MHFVSPSACVCLVDVKGTSVAAFQEPQEYRKADFCTIADAELYTALCCVSNLPGGL